MTDTERTQQEEEEAFWEELDAEIAAKRDEDLVLSLLPSGARDRRGGVPGLWVYAHRVQEGPEEEDDQGRGGSAPRRGTGAADSTVRAGV